MICLRRNIRLITLVSFLIVFLFPTADAKKDKPKNCLDCHKEKYEELSGKNNHPPFRKKNCYACHLYHGFTPQQKLKGVIDSVCSQCHAILDGISEDHLHYPLTDESSCIECHDPHSSDFEKLLKVEQPDLCFECHDEPEMGDENSMHPPYFEKQCLNCHDPHGTAFSPALKSPAGELCLGCHTDVLDGFSPDVMHTADNNKSCDNCHVGHKSENNSLLSTPPEKLCLSCHTEIDELLSNNTPHTVLSDDGCEVCHSPHFEKGKSIEAASVNELCLTCHSEIEDLLALAVPHSPAAEDDCSVCHNPHIQINPADQAELCYECHDSEDKNYLGKHLGILPSNCSGCHNPHGSDKKKLIYTNEHPPFEKRECETCHEDNLITETLQDNELCLNCHDEPKSDEYHNAEILEEVRCVGCHSAHTSNQKSLLIKH